MGDTKLPWRGALAVFVAPSSPFDNFILLTIVLNSISIACVDYQHVDDNYQPSTDLSLRNDVIEKAEYIFTIIFSLECILKIAAYGLWRGKQAYLRDGWNVLDLFIVIVSILGLLPNAPNFSVLRSIRAMRPLRSISKLPSLRKIIGAFIGSIGDLANVIVMLLFLLVSFALFGVTFWRGLFHSRCRLTPFPVKMPIDCRNITEPCWNEFILDAIADPASHRCLPISNDDLLWHSTDPQDCIWPIDTEDTRVCSLLGFGGDHSCVKNVDLMGTNVSRTCGSNYDSSGSPRFINSDEPYGFGRMKDDVFYSDFNWGLTNFDDFGSAFVTTFQVLTMEGWSDIMYRTFDAWPAGPTIITYAALIIIGSQLVINIMLAVITGSLDDMECDTDSTRDSQDDGTSPRTKQKRRAEQSLITSRVQRLVATKSYEYFILFVTILNTIILSCDHYGISPEFEMVLESGNFFTTVVFCVDMMLINISSGFCAYWSAPSTFFDGIIALASAAELIIARTAGDGVSGKSVMSVFRSLRLVRLFKMVQQWKSLHSLLNTIGRAAADVRSFGVLLFLFVFIYALVGMQLFSNRLHFDELTGAHISIGDPKYSTSEIPRSNFDGLFISVTTIFQVLSGENWNEVMYDCWKATSWIAPLFFISLVVLGIFIVLNLFLAILLKQFDDDEPPDGSQRQLLPETEHVEVESASILSRASRRMKKCVSALAHCNAATQTCQYPEFYSRCKGILENKRFDLTVTIAIILSSIVLALDNPLNDPDTPFSVALEVLNYLFTAIFIAEFLFKVAAYGPLTYFSEAWNILDFSAVAASVLEMFNIGAGKSLRAMRTLRVLRPLKMINRFPEIKLVVDALLSSVQSVVNVGLICVVFFLTFAIFGVTFLKGTFYECSVSSLTEDQTQLVTYPVPPKNFSDIQLSWLDLESNSCSANQWGVDYTPTSREVCLCLNSEWVPTIAQNFDNVLRGFALLFEISTTEGWVDIMHAAVDQRGMDMQPVRDSNELWAIYFILFLVLGAFFILELFVGVIIENFARIKEIKGCGLMTPAQKEWALTQAFVMKVKPERRFNRPETRLRMRFFDLVMNPWFDRFIVGVIIFNCACIATASFGDSAMKTGYSEVFNEVCSSIFIIEAMLKMTAFGLRPYFRDRWNRFDVSIVIGLVIGFAIKQFIEDDQIAASISAVISLMRIGRLIRLIKMVKSLRLIVNSIITAIPGIINIGGLLLLLFFVYAVIGVQLYGTIGFQGELSEHANFRSIGNAMLLLFRFATGENWNGFMWDLTKERELCDPNPTYDKNLPWCLKERDYPECTDVNGCSAGMSVFLYFYSFILIVGLVVLNMFVGVVLEAFENSQESDILNPADLDHFVEIWAEYDPDATYYIKASDVQSFLRKLRPPLGIKDEDDNISNLGDLYFKDQSLLEISVNERKQVNIVNVATQVAKRLVKAKQGENFGELSNDHPIHRRVMKQREEMKMTLGDVYMNDARVILRAVNRFRKKIKRRRANKATVYPEGSNDAEQS